MRASLSIIDYLNALPLNLAFKEGAYEGEIGLHFDFPSQCADNLAANRVDGGLISSIEYQRIPGLSVVPGICIAAREHVKSVVILAKKQLRDVKVVAVDRFSRSSVTLLEVLFWRDFGLRPTIVPMTPHAEHMLQVADAALIIGDAALRLTTIEDTQVHDLAEWWFRGTGLPFVFAFWALRSFEHQQWLARRLQDAKAYGMQHVWERLEQASVRWCLPTQEIETYLGETIRYDMGEEELASLDRFYRYADECGLLVDPDSLRLVETDG
ncbi:MAG: menaquinone biosynthesis protein [Acidobacteria bacterium]|nr:menaquinone biosynthesis protein [Acidobacteriota bacterium]